MTCYSPDYVLVDDIGKSEYQNSISWPLELSIFGPLFTLKYGKKPVDSQGRIWAVKINYRHNLPLHCGTFIITHNTEGHSRKN